MAQIEVSKTYTAEEGKKFEDGVLAEIKAWPPEKKATVYFVLNCEGMNVHDARNIRIKAKLTGG